MKKEALKVGSAASIAALAAMAIITTQTSAAAALNQLTSVEEAQGFASLFDGSLRSFNDHFVNYRMQDSTNVALPPDWKVDSAIGAVITDGSQNSDIRSKVKYADFDLRFEYRNEGDGGVYYRFNLNNNVPWLSGVEFSIFNDYDNCKGCAGAALDLYGPQPLIYRPYSSQAWNSGRIVVVKDSVEHWLNGSLVVAYKYHSADFWTRFDNSRWAKTSLTLKVPGNRSGGYIEKGYLGFQALAKARWQLRNLRINPASAKMGYDKWWSTEALKVTGITAAGSGRTGKTARDFGRGALIFRTGNSPVTVDGRAALKAKP
jgi:hypothetical protein